MPSSHVAALAALASFALAAPAPAPALGDALRQAFSVPLIETGIKKLLSGPLAMQATYQKFNKPVPAHIAAAAAAAAATQGSVAANPEQYDSSYLCPVQVGTTGVTLQLDFDTGSSDLWVFSTLQPSGQTTGHTLYNPSSSSTSRRQSGETWDISYGDGSGASGVVYSDKVVIGGVTATSQAVEAATSVASSFTQQTNNDGLVGLAFDSINTASPAQVPTFFSTVKRNLASPLFAAVLKKGKAGSYDFGYIDTSKYTGSISYTPVDSSQGFWGFTAGGYGVGSSTTSGSFSAIADTGTTLIYVPASIVKAYYSQVSGATNSASAGGYVFPCSSTLPSFSLIINGQKRSVPGSYINYAPYSGSTCFGGIQSSAGIGINIIGDIFLKGQYVVFDSNGPRIGFAQQAGV